MIPIQLHLKNFLSYGPTVQTIDFGPYPLICLSGKNGHGKSALLDAITWALWGQARKTTGSAKPDQGLLHLGQTQMMVIFDFTCNGTHYRIKREYAQTYGKPYANLEFGTVEELGTKWIPLTSKTIRSTQEIIENTLRLSYEAFTNSAFLRQGYSHEFSTKSPKERKEILAAILGLHEYELVRKQALEKVKDLNTQKQTYQLYQEKLSQELLQQSSINQEYENLKKQLHEIESCEHEITQNYEKLTSELETIQEKQKEQQVLAFKLEQITRQQEQLRQQVHAIRNEWRDVQRSHRQLKNPKELEQQKEQLQCQRATLQKQLQQKLKLKEELLHAKSALQQIEQAFIQEYNYALQEQQLTVDRLYIKVEHVTHQIKTIEEQERAKKTELLQHTNELATIKQKLSELTIDKKNQLHTEQQFEKRKNFYQLYRSQGVWITNELELLQQKQQLSKDDKNPSCPLCEQNLSVSRKKFLHQKFSDQERFLTHRLKRLTQLVTSLKETLITQHAQLADYQKKQEEQQQLIFTTTEYEKKIGQLSHELAVIHNHKEKLQKDLHSNSTHYHTDLQVLQEKQNQRTTVLTAYLTQQQPFKTVEMLTQHLTEIKYDEKEHERVQQQYAVIEQELQTQAHIIQQYEQQESRKHAISALCLELKKLKTDINALHEQLKTYAIIGQEVKEYEHKKYELNLHVKTIQTKKEQLLQQKGRLELALKRLEDLEKESIFYQKQCTENTQLAQDYQAIAAATSKDGVQALLIEQLLPEIEYEANSLLSKLTQNQAHIIIESLRDLKKGGSKETLDIKISDAAGIRPYELFSGGEAFRIDFALRIAISKLLARRAGTSLQTLIIDEGFGSQDDEGLSHIMDAIYNIQDDFSKIIIVSHLPSMKDCFPVHFYVEKKSHGSTVHIIEQG